MNWKTARRLVADTGGGAAIMMALSLPVVIGGLGLGTEVGLWYFNQRKLQNAADVAAYAAATELRAGRDLVRIEQAAADAAVGTGFDSARGTIEVVTPYGGSADEVEVQLEERLPRMFTSLFAEDRVALGGRAVAQLTGGVPTCVLALDPSEAGAVTFMGNTETTITGCNVHSNSLHDDSVLIDGSPVVRTDCVSTSGGIHLGREHLLRLADCTAPYERARVVADPFEGLDPPTDVMAEPCQSVNTFGENGAPHTIQPGRYCGGLKIQRESTLAPGVYVVEGGDVEIGSLAKVSGEGVTIYIKGNGIFKGNGQADIQLKAPTSGPYEGVLLFADAPVGSTPARHVINGTSTSFFDGAIYAPRGDTDVLGNNNNSSACLQVIARTVRFSGNSSVGIDCTGRFDNVRAVRQIRLVE